MNYKLQKADYRALWLLLSPEDIKEEFGEYAHSARHIRTFYERYGVNRINQSLNEVIQLLPRDDEDTFKTALFELIGEEREETVRKIWNKIKEHERQWDFT